MQPNNNSNFDSTNSDFDTKNQYQNTFGGPENNDFSNSFQNQDLNNDFSTTYRDNPLQSNTGQAQNLQTGNSDLGFKEQPNQDFLKTQSSNFDTNQDNSFKPNEPVKNKTSSLRKVARTVAFMIVLGVILGVTGVIFALTNPKDERSNWVIKNTFLNNLVNTSSSISSNSVALQSSSPSSQSQSEANSEDPNLEFKDSADSKPVVEVVQDVLPSVLSISLKSKASGPDFAQDLSAGSGYIVNENGLVVTNKHVVSVVCKNDISRIQITGVASDQKAYNLTLKSIDPVDDVAILEIEDKTQKFKPINLFDSQNLKLGQEVIAIGNVLGELQNTVSKGIVSGLDRSFETAIKDPCTDTEFQADALIQTDAAINRGNSGGPLFNASGQLIGMNTLGTVDAQNIGLAIPSRTIKTILEGYLSKGSIVRPRIGLASLQITPLRKAQNPWIPVDYGEIIFSEQGSPIVRDSAAAQAGLREGDIILEVDGEKITSSTSNPSPLRRAILGKQAQTKIILTVLRSDTKTEGGYTYQPNPSTVELTLGSVSFDLIKKQAVIS
jgi:S1-C subfamily serine protease